MQCTAGNHCPVKFNALQWNGFSRVSRYLYAVQLSEAHRFSRLQNSAVQWRAQLVWALDDSVYYINALHRKQYIVHCLMYTLHCVQCAMCRAECGRVSRQGVKSETSTSALHPP